MSRCLVYLVYYITYISAFSASEASLVYEGSEHPCAKYYIEIFLSRPRAGQAAGAVHESCHDPMVFGVLSLVTPLRPFKAKADVTKVPLHQFKCHSRFRRSRSVRGQEVQRYLILIRAKWVHLTRNFFRKMFGEK